MNQDYIDKNTRDWKLLEKDSTLELWEFFDEVAWARQWTIKNNGIVKVVYDDDYDARRVYSDVLDIIA